MGNSGRSERRRERVIEERRKKKEEMVFDYRNGVMNEREFSKRGF